jgi:hypothetical protein
MRKYNILRSGGFFLLGVLTWFFMDLTWDWEGNVEDLKRGYQNAKEYRSGTNNLTTDFDKELLISMINTSCHE